MTLIVNNSGLLTRFWDQTNRYGEMIYTDPELVPCSVVTLNPTLKTTPIRSDASPTRATSDELDLTGQILFPIAVAPKLGDKFEISGVTMRIKTAELRFDVFGKPDHFECDMEAWPQ